MVDLISWATSSEGLARIGVSGEELIVADLSTFAQLFQSNNSGLQEVVGQRVDPLGINSSQFTNSSIGVFDDLADQSLRFGSAPQVQVGLGDSSVEVSSFFEGNIFSNQVQVVGVDLDDLSKVGGIIQFFQ